MSEQAVGRFDAARVTISSSVATKVLALTKPSIGIQVLADEGNSGVIYLGNSNVSTTKGYPLSAGKSVFLPIGDTDNLYALASVNNDKVFYLVL